MNAQAAVGPGPSMNKPEMRDISVIAAVNRLASLVQDGEELIQSARYYESFIYSEPQAVREKTPGSIPSDNLFNKVNQLVQRVANINDELREHRRFLESTLSEGN